MKLDEIQQLIEKHSKIDRSDLAHESTSIPEIHGKFLSIWRDEKLKLRQLRHKMKTLWKEKWLYYSGKAGANVYKEKPFDLKILRQDMNIFLEGDDDIQQLDAQIEIQNSKVEYLEAFITQLNQRTWHFRNAIEYLRFTQGQV